METLQISQEPYAVDRKMHCAKAKSSFGQCMKIRLSVFTELPPTGRHPGKDGARFLPLYRAIVDRDVWPCCVDRAAGAV
jgi:hypothetical protein